MTPTNRGSKKQPPKKYGFRAIKPKNSYHAAILEDLARRIDDE